MRLKAPETQTLAPFCCFSLNCCVHFVGLLGSCLWKTKCGFLSPEVELYFKLCIYVISLYFLKNQEVNLHFHIKKMLS